MWGEDDNPHALCNELVERLEARIDELEKIVDRLPRTEDGVPIAGGEAVYALYGDIVRPWIVRCPHVASWVYDITDCYSTREAAEAARGKQ